MKQLQVEKTASRGIAVAPVYYYQEPDLTPEDRGISEEQVSGELEKFENARKCVMEELGQLAKTSEIFAAHQEIAGDFMLQDSVCTRIRTQGKNAQLALTESIEEIANLFAGMDDEYMRERAADVRDVGKRLAARLKGKKLPDLGSLQEECIVVARDLYSSDTVKMNAHFVRGIITQEGGVTSHVSILAKMMNIPILVGVQGILEQVRDGSLVCMDAEEGSIVIDPEDEVQKQYLEKKAAYERERELLLALRGKPAVTKAGKRISLCANVGNVEDVRQALPVGIDGVGLFRSEFLYMERDHFPTEEEQFQVYKEAAELIPSELTIRTLDIGGDKELPYFSFEKEENPFLGWRAIRISLELREQFKEQLRAILRASAFGHVRIMFPMIISLWELGEGRALVEECKKELREEGIAFDENIEVGMMIETPASVLQAHAFAREADFFSIGTNDLTQYLLAVDRGNKKVANRYDFMHPAVLQAIRQVIEAGHTAGIKVGMCGEMAGDTGAVPTLLEMGLDEFSMSAGAVDYVRSLVLNN